MALCAAPQVSIFVRAISWCVFATSTMATLGAEVGGVLTAWGLLGFGATMSLQQAARDLVSAVQLFLARPFDLGDQIDAGKGHGQGEVVAVNLAYTTLRLISSNRALCRSAVPQRRAAAPCRLLAAPCRSVPL